LKIYISQDGVSTQLRCGHIFSNHFITNFSMNVPVKKNLKIGQYLAKIWTNIYGLLFWATLYIVVNLAASCIQQTHFYFRIQIRKF